ncbi:hypothetical protein GCM10009840_17830 [Pseudolysinimonas kribbensis]|uniref:hypothetical protein n=1 Tax=Pseudolysinimonas kribbensis TaxID=433641 RepID=UPI0031D32E38
MTALNINSLTLGEVAKVEELSGQAFGAIAQEDKPKGLALAALAFVAKRRSDPKYSWNDAQGLTFAEFGELITLGDDENEEGDLLAAVTGEPAPKARRASAQKI